jgi:hypothetical protein
MVPWKVGVLYAGAELGNDDPDEQGDLLERRSAAATITKSAEAAVPAPLGAGPNVVR